MCNQFINVLSLKVQESKYIESTANVVEKPEFEKTQNMNCQYLMRIMENKQRQIILDSDNKYACDQCTVGTLCMAGSVSHEIPMKVNTEKMA